MESRMQARYCERTIRRAGNRRFSERCVGIGGHKSPGKQLGSTGDTVRR